MKTIQIGKHEVKFYDSIKEMPIQRYNAMQGFLMQDSGIGSDMRAVEQHFKNLDAFLIAGKIQDAIQERQNLHINFYAALEKIDFKSMSFACMISTIDGLNVGISDEELKGALKKIEGVTLGQVSDILEELKKNFIGN
jgi:hypothetical protein